MLIETIEENQPIIESFFRQVVSKNPEVGSANQSFSPPRRSATTLEELEDGFSPVFTKQEIPDFAQHHIFTTEQETFPIPCITTQPLLTGETTTLEDLSE